MKDNYFQIEEYKKNNKIKINNGIQILRIILSYLILQLHCYNIRLSKNIILIKTFQAGGFYAPTFFIISNYFSYNIFIMKKITKIYLRIQRIMIPYILWPLFFFIRNNIINYFKNKEKYRIRDLIFQFIFGKRIHEVFWFQCNLILSFILFSIISLALKSNFLFIIQIIGIGSSFYYSFNYYNKLFYNYSPVVKNHFQDLSKALFYGSIGISLGSLINVDTLRKHQKKTIFFSLITLYFIRDFNNIKIQFYYLKCILYGIGSISIFILFSILFSENINKTVNFIIKNISIHSGGVYYLHTKIRKILSSKFLIIKNRTLAGCFINYVIIYVICLFGMKIFGKTKLRFLFI